MRNLIKEPSFANQLERDYVVKALIQREQKFANLFFYVAALTWIPPLVAHELQFIGRIEALILTSYSVLQSAVALIMLLARPKLKFQIGTIFSMMVLGQIAWASAGWIAVTKGSANPIFASIWLTFMFVGNMLMPLRSWAHNVIAVIYLTTAITVFLHFPNPDLGITLTALALLIGQNAQIFSQRLLKLEAIRTFRDKSKYIPRQVLMDAIRNNTSIDEVFKPTEKYCVFLAAGWPEIAVIANRARPESLSLGLTEFYRGVVDSLTRQFPEGRFFMDWFADELFIVAFAESNAPDTRIARGMFDWAVKLIDFKSDFSDKHGFPKAIHIGISAGQASVGVYGRDGIAKASAFGVTPGEAKRLQQFATRISGSNPDEDSIIITPELFQTMGIIKHSCRKINMTKGNQIRNISAQELYVWPSRQNHDLKPEDTHGFGKLAGTGS